jgi:hypothetical protein
VPAHLLALADPAYLQELVQACISEGADVNAKDTDGNPLLYLAITMGCSAEVVNSLIRHGADVNAIGPNGSILCAACLQGARDPFVLATVLSHHQVEINQVDVVLARQHNCAPHAIAALEEAIGKDLAQAKGVYERMPATLVGLLPAVLRLSNTLQARQVVEVGLVGTLKKLLACPEMLQIMQVLCRAVLLCALLWYASVV